MVSSTYKVPGIQNNLPPLQFRRRVKNVEIAIFDPSVWATISTIQNFDGRAKRASEKIAHNFNVVTISTFWLVIFHNNFDVLTISMFDIFQMYNNFNVLQFRRAREARSRKNPDNFDEFTISTFSISGKSNNFDDVTISTFLHPQSRYNFNVFAISTFQFPGEIEELCIISCITIHVFCFTQRHCTNIDGD